MASFLTMLLAAIPNVLMAVLGKIATEKFLQSVLEKIIIYGLQKLAPLTTNTLDDEIVADMVKKLQGSDG